MGKEFDNLLERQRKHMRMSLDKASKLLGCTKPHLWEIEKGKSCNPSAKLLNAFRSVYGISAETLLDLFD